jgi:hypothetical protein
MARLMQLQKSLQPYISTYAAQYLKPKPPTIYERTQLNKIGGALKMNQTLSSLFSKSIMKVL